MILERVGRRLRAMLLTAYEDALPPRRPGMRLTPKRLLNHNLVRFQYARGHTKLFGYPTKLTVESTNVCNLNCPYCFTGANEAGRKRTTIPMDLYCKLLDEVGDYVCYLEFHNWGEPLLNKRLHEMIGLASSRGISTGFSTNFSVPFDVERAEKLVSSGLALLGVSLDGARQESYEQYRVGGDLQKALANVRLVNQAKQKLGSSLPRIFWEFHVFNWNKDDIDLARTMASELGMEFAVAKGWMAGEEWDSGGDLDFGLVEAPSVGTAPDRCQFLWTQGVINNDGGVAPCCGAFYKEDDYGSVVDASFKEVWNNKSFQEARRLFHLRDTSGHGKNLVCYDCPSTVTWDNYKRHRAQRLPTLSFEPGYTANDSFNYFFSRRPSRVDPDGGAAHIELTPVGDAPRKET